MNERLNWMFPSLYLGRLFSTGMRVSLWFALVPLVLCARYSLEFSFSFTVLLFLSAFLHELAHVVAARRTGGTADEIHLTPLGGVAQVKPGQGALGLGLTALAGPIVNLLICLAVFPGWYRQVAIWSVLNPFVLPITSIDADQLPRDLGAILFAVNWIMLLVNLLPVTPLDGGQILRAILSTRIHPELVHRTALHVGLAVSILLLVSGTAFDVSQVVLIGTFVLVINIVQLFQEDLGEAMDDSGYGYDFSSAFESLDNTTPTTTQQAPPSMLQQWRDSRRLKREKQEHQRRLEAEQQLDSLLAKVHETGLQSLSEDEQKRLRNCSELLRARPKISD